MKYRELLFTFGDKSKDRLAEISVARLEKRVADELFYATDRACKELYADDLIPIDRQTIDSPVTPWGEPAAIYPDSVNSKGELKINGLYAIHLVNVRLLPAPGLLIYADQYIIKEYLGAPFHQRAMHWLKRSRAFSWGWVEATKNINAPAREYANAIDFSTDPGDQNVFHWIARVLPKTKLLELLPSDWPLVFTYEPNEFQKESLATLGVKNPLLIIDSKTPAAFGNYVIIEGSWAIFHRAMIQELRAKILSSRAPRTPEGTAGSAVTRDPRKKLFIYRENDWTRKLLNRQEVMDHLTQLDYHHNSLRGLGLLETAKLFSEADEIIFEHGAAGVFLLFTKSSAKIIEIIPSRVHKSSREPTNFFYWGSKILNRSFGYIVCQNIRCDPWAEYKLDIKQLEELMSTMQFSSQ